MNTIVVCVDYADLLGITLPRNLRHVGTLPDACCVVTSPNDYHTQLLASELGVYCHVTNAFYERNALFNKGAAIQEAMQHFAPADAWMMLLDADIVLPAEMPLDLQPGCLYSPRRHMCLDPPAWDGTEQSWPQFPVYPEREFAGYCQIFHMQDPAVLPWPNYPANWKMANCDSEFQNRWPEEKKVRPAFNVLHLGPPAKNWAGMSTLAQQAMQNLLAYRRRRNDYEMEKLQKEN